MRVNVLRDLNARASTVHYQVDKAKGSSSREVRLNSSCVVVVDRSDLLKEKVAEANAKMKMP